MTLAFVSGQAAKVGLVDGTDYSYFDLATPTQIRELSAQEFASLFAGTTDVEELSVQDVRQTYTLAKRKFHLDRGLMLFDIALTESDVPISFEAAVEFIRIMESDAEVASALRNYIFASPNADLPDDDIVAEFSEISIEFTAFVHEVKRSQINILKFQSGLHKAFEALEIAPDLAQDFYFHAISSGAFSELVMAANTGANFNNVVLSIYARLSHVREARRIVQAWTQNFIDRSVHKRLRHLEAEIDDSAEDVFERDRPSHEIFQAVVRQQASIIERLRAHDWTTARRYADALVSQQISDGHDAYAAKSMSKLAIEARHFGQRKLELEWAQRAAELAPNDSKARGILADTYLLLFRLPEAEAAFKQTIGLGNESFGMGGLGRVARIAGRLEEALSIFANLITNLGDKVEAELWAAYAETYRDMGKPLDALAIYEAGLNLHPGSVYLYCGKAAVLADLGRWPESRQLYEYAAHQWPNDDAPLCGLGETYKDEGQFQKALELYDNAVDKFPQSVIAACGRAEVFRAWGHIGDAHTAYENVVKKFPGDPTPLTGLAETLRDQRRYDEAIGVLTQGNQNFPSNAKLRNVRASVVKLSGNLTEALRLYDENVKDFPQNLYSLTGRANLLRLLGEYNAALETYDRILEQSPRNKFAQNAKAAIFIALEQFADAESLLDTAQLNVEADWNALHIEGMLHLRKGDLLRARQHLSDGLDCPFFRIRQQFVTSIGLLDLQEGQTANTLSNIASQTDALSIILSAHALVRLKQFGAALTTLTAVNDNNPPLVKSLRQSIWRVASNAEENPDNERLYRNEIEAILQAA